MLALALTLHCSFPSAPDFELDGYSTVTQQQPGYSEGGPPVSQPSQLTSKYSRAMQIFKSIMASKLEEEPQEEKKDSQSQEFRVIFHGGKMDIIVEDWDSESHWLMFM